MYHLLKKFLFLLDAEKAHKFTLFVLKIFLSFPGTKSPAGKFFNRNKFDCAVKVAGIKFPNVVGLAAGFDKNATYISEMACLGFGFIEIGTVTPKPQEGNPKPRLFRLKEDRAIVNRMGFNNDGVEAIAKKLKTAKHKVILGGNIGKNKSTPNENAIDDYLCCFAKLHPFVNYFVVNVSSPNTPNLRDLQDKDPLKKILQALQKENRSLENPKPIFLKISPDLSETQLDDIVEIVENTGISGVIATNTTISRDDLKSEKAQISEAGQGGLSGAPLKKKSTEIIRYLSTKSQRKFAIIGVGGIFSGKDAMEKLEAGANLVQIYSGLIYKGPGLVSEIKKSVYKMSN